MVTKKHLTNRIVILDFDNTLFRTKEFWREVLFPQYQKIGIPYDVCEHALVQSTTAKVDYFTQQFFIDELCVAIKNVISKKILCKIFERTVYSPCIKKYYYPEAFTLLRRVASEKRILMSYGDVRFKKKFFSYCDIGTYFAPRMIVVSPQKKERILRNLVLSGRIILVNDVLSETEKMIEVLLEKGCSVDAFLFDPKKNYDPSKLNPRIRRVTFLKDIIRFL